MLFMFIIFQFSIIFNFIYFYYLARETETKLPHTYTLTYTLAQLQYIQLRHDKLRFHLIELRCAKCVDQVDKKKNKKKTNK